MERIDVKKYKDIINKNSSKKSNDNNLKKYFKGLVIRLLIVLLLFLTALIACKCNSQIKDKVYKYLYTEDISFTKIKKIYNKYLGGILPIKKEVDTEKVFQEKLKYTDLSIYQDGIKLSVGNNYLVPALQEGMVVFVGDKENYGNTIIVEDLDGVRYWYGNITTSSLKLYDYIEKGSLIGETSTNLYLVFSKDDNYLDYEKYIN